LTALFRELSNITNREFFEVSERGTNFQYIPDDQKAQLPLFFSWFKNFPQKVLQSFQESRFVTQDSFVVKRKNKKDAQ
jgi:hypothetical protein